jgi:hypothetical protein
MTRPLQILFICTVIILPAGCADTQKTADTKGIKIGDLVPPGKRAQQQALRTINIDIISYEIDAETIASMENIWQILSPGKLRYNEFNSFTANGLRAGMGKFREFVKVTTMLKTANATNLPKTSLLLMDGQPELVRIARTPSKKTISYIDRQGAVKTAEIGLGIAGLQIHAQQINTSALLKKDSQAADSAQMASVHVVPAVLASTEGIAPALAERIKERDLRIYAAGFSAIMKPGEFVMLGPSEYKQNETAAVNLFFSKPGSKPTVRIFLLVCVSIF